MDYNVEDVIAATEWLDNKSVDSSDPDNIFRKARLYVVGSYNNSVEEESYELSINDLRIVWFSYTLANWKVLISTDKSDGLYFEVTHDHTKNTTYVDTYKKIHNDTFSQEGN